MKRFLALPAWPFLIAGLILAAVCIALLAGCGTSAPPRGSAQDDSVQKQARAATEREAADKAAQDAAAADAQAMLDAEVARRTAIPADIEKAAQSRAAAIIARAVASAEEVIAAKAEVAADLARRAGEKERAAEAASEDARSWASLCRWFGLGSLVLGALIGVAVGYLVAPQLGIYLGGGVAGLGMLVVAFGATVTWLPLVLAAGIVAALAAWALFHGRQKQVTAALSHTLDTVEGNTASTIEEAKAKLAAAVKRSGLAGWFDRLRAGWTTATVALDPVPAPSPSQAPTVVITAEPKP